MDQLKLRQSLSKLPAWIEHNLPDSRRFYIVIAMVFGIMGYWVGMALMSRFAPEPISLEAPVLPPVEGGANPVLPATPPKQTTTDPDIPLPLETTPPEPELQPLAVPDRSAFTAAENCRIWKRTFPEAAKKLKPGDACY